MAAPNTAHWRRMRVNFPEDQAAAPKKGAATPPKAAPTSAATVAPKRKMTTERKKLEAKVLNEAKMLWDDHIKLIKRNWPEEADRGPKEEGPA